MYIYCGFSLPTHFARTVSLRHHGPRACQPLWINLKFLALFGLILRSL